MTDKSFRVKNWEKFQYYKFRNPPWIKVYNDLLDNYDFEKLSDSAKWHLVAIWLLASRNKNELPWDANWIKSRTHVKQKINLEQLLELGFIEIIQPCSNMHAECIQDACPETETETETEKRRVKARSETKRAKTPKEGFEEFIASLKTNPGYKGIDIDRELAKMDAWLQTPKGSRRQKTKGFVLNWLNRIDPPVDPKPKGSHAGSTGGKYDHVYEK